MQKWEYVVASVRVTGYGEDLELHHANDLSIQSGNLLSCKKGADYPSWLNSMGEDGWKIVADSAWGSDTSASEHLVTLRRPKP